MMVSCRRRGLGQADEAMSGKRKATVSLEQLDAGFTDDELSTCLKVRRPRPTTELGL